MKIPFFHGRDDHPNLSREVISSYYGGISQPDMTRVSVKVEQPIKEERTYECEVTVEGRGNIVSGTHRCINKGSGITNVMITREQLTAVSVQLATIIVFLLPFSQLQASP